MVTAFNIIMNNFTLNPIGNLDQIPEPNLDKHVRYFMFPNPECDKCKELYIDAQEFIPDKLGTPLLKGWPVRMTVFKDTDHTHDLLTRRSVTGILLMIKNTPVRWFLKR